MRIGEWIFDNIGKVIVFWILLLLGLAVFGAAYDETVIMPRTFAAWCKETGNPKSLSYDEWRDLVRMNEDQKPNSTVFVPMPIHTR
jgi:hypothetical protein